jgi:carboxyl-terminal processing protease
MTSQGKEPTAMEHGPRQRSWYFGPVILLTLVVGIFLGKGWERTGHATEAYEELRTFSEVLTKVQKHYVEPVKVKELVEGAIRGMLSTLDPHSAYMTPEMYKEIQVETKGEFGGVGIQIGIKDNRLTVIAPIEGTPAHRAGIHAGDSITKVDDQATKDLTLMDAVQKMRGPRGTKVALTVEREGSANPLIFQLVRDTIKIQSVRSRVIDEKIGYIRVSQFQESTADDMGEALEEFRKKSLQSLILDLRNNPGGLLTAAVEVSEHFVGPGKMIVYIKTRDGRKDEYVSRAKRDPTDRPIIVLVNEGSASASEIVAGALQDWELAAIVGTTTFGKGSVQTILPLSDMSGLRLTTAKYYTPKGRSIQSTGITPDITVKLPVPGSEENQSKRDKDSPQKGGANSPHPGNGASLGGSAPGADPSVKNDPQLEKAVELLKTWKIFKGLRKT